MKRYSKLLCLAVTMFVPVASVDAFWGGVGKMSGPGPFLAFDFVYAFGLRKAPRVTEEMLQNGVHLRTLNRYLLKVARHDKLADFTADESAVRSLGDLYDEPSWKQWKRNDEETDTQRIERFRAILRSTKLSGLATATDDQALMSSLNATLLTNDDFQKHFANRYRFRGWSKIPGLFTSQRAINLPIRDPDDPTKTTNAADNQLFTLAIGYAVSGKNDLSHPDDFSGSDTVHWFTVYPAHEWRFGLSDDETTNYFVNVGPAIHTFTGNGFESFQKVSARGRVGVRIWDWLDVAGQLDYWGDGIRHEQFGSTDDRVHKWSGGVVFTVEWDQIAR